MCCLVAGPACPGWPNLPAVWPRAVCSANPKKKPTTMGRHLLKKKSSYSLECCFFWGGLPSLVSSQTCASLPQPEPSAVLSPALLGFSSTKQSPFAFFVFAMPNLVVVLRPRDLPEMLLACVFRCCFFMPWFSIHAFPSCLS